ncbi:MAG: hypothetical protein JXB23_16905 [Candidatus Aminicenantes bacterium]|nr:hypothetical protein [Candidatus Aminicenantes bacterium]
MFLYWFENVIIGFFNVIKMAMAQGESSKTRLYSGKKLVTGAQKLPLILFFIVHFGMFTFGHGVFVIVLFGKNLPPLSNLLPAAFSLFVSHGISFAYNFIKSGEYKRVAFQDLFSQPYSRVFIMHVTIVIGAGIALLLESPTLILAFLILLKIFVDVVSHKKEHTKFAESGLLKKQKIPA